MREVGDYSAKYITARLGQTPLEIVPMAYYRGGPQTGSIADIAQAFVQETNRQVLGAVNGGFFDLKTGLPLGFLFRDGMIEFFNMPQGVRRSMVGFTRPRADGNGAGVLIDSPRDMPKVFLHRLDPRNGRLLTSFPVHHVNVPGGRHAFSLFNSRYAQTIAATPGGIYLFARQRIAASDGRLPVYEITGRWDEKGKTVPLSAGGLVIALHGDAKSLTQQLPIGSMVRPFWTPPKGWRNRQVVHGLLAGPRLLEKGKIRVTAKEENLAGLKSRDRVALGVKPDGEAVLLWLHHNSRGANLGFEELAKTLLDMGATEAIALDGGSSRALMASAQDPYKRDRYLYMGRPVSNALLVSLPADRS